ncbi:hypothetical protein OROMI_002720 [Orobanche minor]
MVSGTGGKLVASSLVAFVIIFALFLLLLVVSFRRGRYPPAGILISNPLGISFVKKNHRIISFAFVGTLLLLLLSRFSWLVWLINRSPRQMVFFVGVFMRLISAIVVMMMKIFFTFLFMARWLTRFGLISIIWLVLDVLTHPILNSSWNDRRVDNVHFTAKRVCERIWNYIVTFNHKVIFKNKNFWKGAALIADRAGVIPAPQPLYKCCSDRWVWPQEGWWKLNTDGVARGNPGEATAGGIIRDHLGNPLIMFSEFLGDRTNNFAELYAIWWGLEFCIDRHFDTVWVEVDSKIALSLIEHSTSSHWQIQGIISKIRAFCGTIEIRFSHIFIEGNAVADWLANQGCDRKDLFLHNVSFISGKLLGLIKLDKMSYPYIRSKKIFPAAR